VNHNDWIGHADRVFDTGAAMFILGEDEHGDLFVPGRTPQDSWRPFSPRNPRHWLAYWHSKKKNTLAWLEHHSAERP
jgi:hypothetical protein